MTDYERDPFHEARSEEGLHQVDELSSVRVLRIIITLRVNYYYYYYYYYYY